MKEFAKVFTDILGDPKLLRADRKGARELQMLPWLIVFAKDAHDDGRLTVNGEPAEPEDIAARVPCTSPKRVLQAFAELRELGVLIEDPDRATVLRFAAWDIRAGAKPSDGREAIAERVRKHRATRRSARNAVTSSDVTPTGNAADGVTGNATEVRSKKEEIREKKTDALHGTSVDVPYVAEFESLWPSYPKRPNNAKAPARKAYCARRRSGVAAREFVDAVERYAAYCTARGLVGTDLVMQGATFFGPNERWTELFEVVGMPKSGAVGSPMVERARTLFALGKQYELFSYGGNKDEYAAKMGRAESDDRAGALFRADAKLARMWEGIGGQTNERFAIDEIARRLDGSAMKAAS